MRASLLSVLLLVTVALLGGCNRIASADAADTPEALAREADRRAIATLSKGTKAEARGWLSQRGNRLFEGDPKDVRELVGDLRADGARKLWFTGIEDFRGARVSGGLVVELPEDPVSRAALLRHQARFEGWETPRPDDGQRYLSFRL